MISIRKLLTLVVILLTIVAQGFSQSMDKKHHTVKVAIKINASPEKVWNAMVADYGHISNFSPYIYSSNYENGSLAGTEGAERKCNFNTKGTQWSHERLYEVDHEEKVARNVVIGGKKLPLDYDNSQAFYSVIDNKDGTSTAIYEFQFRTTPSFLGAVAKGSFKKQMSGTLVGLKHYVETGEKVTPMNGRYKEIKKEHFNSVIELE